MEPPPTPPPKPPLGPGFYVTLLLPVAILALAVAFASRASDAAAALLVCAGIAAIVCAGIVASQLGNRLAKTPEGGLGVSVIVFFGVLGFYAVCAFAGCVAAISLS